MIEIQNEAQFEKLIDENERVVLDFYATWCAPCKLIAPTLDALAKERPEIAFAKVNIDQYPDLFKKFNVGAMPTIKFFKQRMVVDSVMGAVNKTALESKIDNLF